MAPAVADGRWYIADARVNDVRWPSDFPGNGPAPLGDARDAALRVIRAVQFENVAIAVVDASARGLEVPGTLSATGESRSPLGNAVLVLRAFDSSFLEIATRSQHVGELVMKRFGPHVAVPPSESGARGAAERRAEDARSREAARESSAVRTNEDAPATDDSMRDTDLAMLEALSEAATPGAWVSWVEGRDFLSGSSFVRTARDDIEMSGATAADYDFIAAAREAVPRLIAEIRRLRGEKR